MALNHQRPSYFKLPDSWSSLHSGLCQPHKPSYFWITIICVLLSTASLSAGEPTPQQSQQHQDDQILNLQHQLSSSGSDRQVVRSVAEEIDGIINPYSKEIVDTAYIPLVSRKKCDCRPLDIAKALRLINRLLPKLQDQVDYMNSRVQDSWAKVLQQTYDNAQAIEPGSSAEIAATGALKLFKKVATKATENMLFTDVSGAKKIYKRIKKGRKKATSVMDQFKKIAGEEKYRKFKKNIPALSELSQKYKEMGAYARQVAKFKKIKKELWARLINNTDCLRQLGSTGGHETIPCKIAGLSKSQITSLKSTEEHDMLVKTTTLLANITSRANLAAIRCDLCALINAERSLEQLKEMSDQEAQRMSKGALGALKTKISIGGDLIKVYSRKGALDNGYYRGFKLAITASGVGGFAGKLTFSAAETIVSVLDNNIKLKAGKSIKGDIKSVSNILKTYLSFLKDWRTASNQITSAQEAIWKKMMECKLSCHSDLASKPRTKQPQHDIINVDNGQWCSYWPWELPGGVFTPDGENPKDPFTPDGWTPPPEHGPPVFIPDGGTFIPGHIDTPKHKKRPKHKPEHTPITYVKVKQSVIENGKAHSKPVAGVQFKFSSLAPDLPVAGNDRIDDDFDKDPVQGVSDKNGNITLGGKGGNRSSQTEAPAFAELFDTIDGIGEAVAAPRHRGSRNTLQITIPSIKSYIIRIRANRNKRNWKNPSSYLNKKAAKYVVRSWVAGDILYAVVAVPKHAGDNK